MDTMAQWLQLAPQPPKLVGDQKWHVFLSYRSVHRPWVIQLYDVLRQLGFEVFLDQYVLAASETLVGSLAEGLERSAAGVLIWSTKTEDSAWCRKECDSMEAKATVDKNFHYVVTTLDSVELPIFARMRIYIDFSEFREGPRGTGLLRLLYGTQGNPLPDAAIRLTTAIDEEVQQSLAKIQSSVNTGDYQRVVELANWDSLAWTTSALLGCRVAESLIKLRRYDDALTILEKVQSLFPKAIRPLQLKGLALARKGAWRAAQAILGDLEAAGEQDPETLGIYARTWMDRYQESQMINHLRKARDLYVRAFKLVPSDSYTGINAAAKSVFLEDSGAAAEYAAAVEKLVGIEKVEGNYWETATVAEVQLMRKNYLKAAELYLAAVTMEPESTGSHETTWLQAKRLMAVLKPSEEERNLIAKAFSHLPA